MSWPLTRPMSEAELYKSLLDEAIRKNPECKPPIFAMMRHACVYDHANSWEVPVKAAQRQLGQFENLFKNLGDVSNGFSQSVDLDSIANQAEYDSKKLHDNLLFGTPDEVIDKLKLYEEIGIDEFIYYASLGLGHKEQLRSMQLFINEVMPAFR